jgi:hypothetical protein
LRVHPLIEVAFPARETAVWYARSWEIESRQGPRRDVVTSKRCAGRFLHSRGPRGMEPEIHA